MNSARHMVTGAGVLFAFVVLSVPALPSGQPSLSTKRLFALFAAQPQARASFVETRYLSILEQPLVSSGTLAFDAPDRLVKRTLKPVREDFVLAGAVLTVARPDADARRSFDVQHEPSLWAFVEAFRATLAGDLDGLERFYRVTLENTARGWRLRLIPTASEMRKRVDTIGIEGAAAQIRRVEIQETGGDRTVMIITPDPS